ncbi:hypothetical protein BHECKSOX_2287 [Bathymodiolus heckerae thiotrophic gill symbiont]|uniref:AbrB/MazE/SpoVT family DNA-binding domain-containing protein n=1 Tax=Bathymodiolus heckerae thiotrophic gill symbiont TaxID=1052212 RepID=UPI0010B3B290|nr:AbrB/MazE/SpoVT family DNA-binding domain-containing protein [Bathymodiolus heckerae thiotrophic gill symbiont]SHN93180.1 hypothetical protein BHECKSOX_2287 [Bathymodiolus heckerae thiotrophic gill symbiont]
MAHLTKIGNSRGVRIPKPIIEQAHLDNVELMFKVVGDGLLISPDKKSRTNWREKIAKSIEGNKQANVDHEWLGLELSPDTEWQW